MKDGKSELNILTQSLSKFLEDNRINLASQESVSLEAANALISKLGFELEPFKVITDDGAPWEEKSAAVRLANKLQKYKRNKRWRKRKRKCIAESLAEVVNLQFVIHPSPNLFFEIIMRLFICLLNYRSVPDLTKLIKKLMNGGLERLPRILQNARY